MHVLFYLKRAHAKWAYVHIRHTHTAYVPDRVRDILTTQESIAQQRNNQILTMGHTKCMSLGNREPATAYERIAVCAMFMRPVLLNRPQHIEHSHKRSHIRGFAGINVINQPIIQCTKCSVPSVHVCVCVSRCLLLLWGAILFFHGAQFSNVSGACGNWIGDCHGCGSGNDNKIVSTVQTGRPTKWRLTRKNGENQTPNWHTNHR